MSYVISSRMPLDVAKHLSTQIQFCRFKSKQKRLGFPSTITRLILEARVEPIEAFTCSGKMIDKTIWLHIEEL